MYLLNNMDELCQYFDNMTIIDEAAGTITDPNTGLVTAIDGTSIVTMAVEEEEEVKTSSPPFVELFDRFSLLMGSSGSPDSAEPAPPTGVVVFGVGGVALAVVAMVVVARRRGRYSSVPEDGEFEI
mmetsp:Transcript_41106/g.109701  ORF Transcript_41106/g.109701 Transcript_41106/m.109701 type:complete len:126 (-) Transcript_41106:259-636(-)